LGCSRDDFTAHVWRLLAQCEAKHPRETRVSGDCPMAQTNSQAICSAYASNTELCLQKKKIAGATCSKAITRHQLRPPSAHWWMIL
jgi:hypothetical protein